MKRVIAALAAVILLFAMTAGALSAGASTVELSPVSKTIISDGTWNYEQVNGYGYEIESYLGSDAAVRVPFAYAKVSVGSVGEDAFYGNATLTAVTLTTNTRRLNKYAFSGCTALEKVTATASLEIIGTGCFYGTASLQSINLADTAVTEVSPYCFADSGIKSLALPESCTSIGNMAFYQCAALEKILIPDSVTEIADTAFDRDEDLVIYCNSGSYAHSYAEEKGIEYVLLDVPVDVTFILGDADGNGTVTILDATKVQRLLVSLIDDPDGMIALRGDADGKGIGILDATKIQRWLAGFTLSESIGEKVTKQHYHSF